MAKLKIATLELVAPKEMQSKITDYLQRTGAFEIRVPEQTDLLTFDSFTEQMNKTSGDVLLVRQALDILHEYGAEKKGLTAMLNPRKTLTAQEYDERSAENEATLQKAKEIVSLYEKNEDVKAEIIRLTSLKDALYPWIKCDIPVKSGFTKSTAYFLGSIRKKLSRGDITAYLAQKFPEDNCIEVQMISADNEASFFAVFCLREQAEEIEQALREFGFIKAPECTQNTPEREIALYDEKTEACKKQSQHIIDELKSYVGLQDTFAFCIDSMMLNKSKWGAYEKIPGDTRVFYLTGFIAQKDAKRFAKRLENDYGAAVQIGDPDENADVPVLLTNNAFSAPLENITGMYSLPSKNDVDPTGVMAFFYYFFFGMMFSDAGYGMLMVLACGFILLFKRDIENKLKNTLRMYLYCGISTAFWGAVYGSWFGDAPAVICTQFLGKDGYSGFFSGIVNPTNDLMRVMIICFVFGLVHLFTGVVLKGITDIKNKQPKEAFCNTVPTVLMVLGLAPVFFGLFIQDSMYTAVNPTLFDSIFNALITGVAGLKTVSVYLLVAGMVLVIITGGRDSKSIGGKLAGGLYAVYNVFGGYLGDVLSYARLLALGLATGIVAQVMNMLGSMFGTGVVKAIAFAVIFTVGHLANFAINVIGAYVHTNRLQYVEFFGKFYEGGGRAFVPLGADTKYMKFKEEN